MSASEWHCSAMRACVQAGLHNVRGLDSHRRGMARSGVVPAMGKRVALIIAGGWFLLLAGRQVPGATSGSAGTPSPCTAQAAHDVVDRFIDAFNRGDIAQLDQLFSAQQFDAYSTDAPGERFNAQAQDRSTLMAYFKARHQQHEHLVLNSMDVSYTDSRDVGFWFRVTRSADDGLPPTRYNGKGGVQCATMPTSLVVWAMDPLAVVTDRVATGGRCSDSSCCRNLGVCTMAAAHHAALSRD